MDKKYHGRRQTNHRGMLPSISPQNKSPIYEQQIIQEYSSPKKISGITSEIVKAQIKNFPLLQSLYQKNSQPKQKRILQVFMNRPSKADKPGYIYGFMSFEENQPFQNNYWIKMGKTINNPFKRLEQWIKDDGRFYNSIFTIWTQYNTKLQSLVHLFFDYARQHRQINGQSRKQWFHFEQREMNAGAVNMINELMHKIHNLEVKTGQQVEQKIGSSFLLKNINVLAQDILTQNDKKNCFVLLGLNKNILQALSNLLNGKCVQFHRKRLLQQGQYHVKSTKETYKPNYNIEIFPEDHSINNQQDNFIEIYRKFSLIYKNQRIRLCLALKQADLESSQFIGLIKTLQIFKKHINYDHFIGQRQPFIITIFDCSKQLKQQTILNYIQEIEYDIGKENYYILSTAKYIFVPELKSNDELQFRKSQIQKYQQLFQQKKQNQLSSLAFNFDSIRNVSLKYTNKFTSSISLLLSNALENLKLFSKSNQSTNLQKAQKLHQIKQCIEILQSKTNHQELFKASQQFLELLNIKVSQSSAGTDLKTIAETIITFQSFLLAQIINQGNMTLSTVFTSIQENINEKKTFLREKQNQKIDSVCKKLKDGLSAFYENLTLSSPQHLQQLIKFADQLTKQKDNDACKLYLKNHSTMKNIEEVDNVVLMLQQTENYQKNGIKCDYTLGRVKQYTYEFLKYWNKGSKPNLQPEKQQTLQRFQYEEQLSRSRRKNESTAIGKNKPESEIQIKKSEVPSSQNKYQFSLSNIKQLIENAAEKSAKYFLINLSKETFSFNLGNIIINKKYVIISKNVVMKNQCSFQDPEEFKQGNMKFKKCLLKISGLITF